MNSVNAGEIKYKTLLYTVQLKTQMPKAEWRFLVHNERVCFASMSQKIMLFDRCLVFRRINLWNCMAGNLKHIKNVSRVELPKQERRMSSLSPRIYRRSYKKMGCIAKEFVDLYRQ